MLNTKVLVSLTSYPKRIGYVDKVIKTLLIQTKKPDKIILWLADSEFENKEEDLPKELVALCDYGLEIKWCRDVKSHKKYLYAMKEYPEYCIITVDDDTFYYPDTVEVLYKSFLRHPNAVSCLRANRITFDENKRINSYSKWIMNEQEFIDIPLMDLLPVGVGGVLYPPHCLDEKLLDENVIIQTSLCQDDIWLKYAEVYCGIETVVAEYGYSTPKCIQDTESTSLSGSINVLGNDYALHYVGAFYDKWQCEDNFIDEKIIRYSKTCINIFEKRRIQTKVLIEQLKKSSVIIYGAGRDASAVYDCLDNENLSTCIECFMVTSKKGNPDKLYEIPVKQVEEVEINKEQVVVVAMDESWHLEVKQILEKNGWGNILYISNEQMGMYFRGKTFYDIAKRDFLISLKNYYEK